MAHAIVHLDKISSKTHFKNIQGHNNREHSPDNVNEKKTYLNENILSPQLPLWDAIENEISERVNGRVRSNSVRGVQVFMSASPEYFRDDPEKAGEYNQAKMEAWRDLSIDFLHDEYKENLIDVKLHLDEDTPHIHAIVVPIDKDGKLSANRGILATPNLVKLQDRYGDKMAPIGLERGIAGSGARKISAREYTRLVKLEAQKLPPVPPQPEMGFIDKLLKGKDYKEELQHYETAVKKRNKAIAQNSRNAIGLTAKNRILEQRVNDLTASNSRLTAENTHLRELAAKVRPLPLKTILDDYKKYHPDEKRAGEIRIISDDLYQTSTKKGRNAIDLVKFLQDCDYHTAVHTLSANYAIDDVRATAVVNMIDQIPIPTGGRVSWKKEFKQSEALKAQRSEIDSKVQLALYSFDEFFWMNNIDLDAPGDDNEKLKVEVERLREEYGKSIRDMDAQRQKDIEKQIEDLKERIFKEVDEKRQKVSTTPPSDPKKPSKTNTGTQDIQNESESEEENDTAPGPGFSP